MIYLTRRHFQPSSLVLINKPTSRRTLFNAGPRHLQILHTRLRLGCSSLKCDLYRRNLVESQHCDAVETPTHFLLSCPLFQNTQQTYLSNLPCPLTSEFLLHGDDRLSDDINISILLSVQKYIRATKRFSTGYNSLMCRRACVVMFFAWGQQSAKQQIELIIELKHHLLEL